MAKFRRLDGAFSWFLIELETHAVERAQRPNCCYKGNPITMVIIIGPIAYLLRMRETAIFPLPIWGRFQLIFSSEKQKVRFIWPTVLESKPRIEPPTLIISAKFEVDTTIPGAQRYTKKWWWEGSETYGERVEREPITGFWGYSPQRGPGAEPLGGVRGEAPLKLKGFGKTTSKSVHKFSTFTTYMQGLVSYFADKKTSVTRLFGVWEALNPTLWAEYGNHNHKIGV